MASQSPPSSASAKEEVMASRPSDANASTSGNAERPSSSKRKHIVVGCGVEEGGIERKLVKSVKWEPENWKQVFENIKEMRGFREEAVDDIGTDQSPVPPEVHRFHSLIMLMLSSQTKDHITYAAMQNLLTRGLTVDGIVEIEEKELEELIQPVSFWRRKAVYIKKTAAILKAQYGGDIPKSVKELCKLPGVGPKIAHMCMNIGWGTVPGINVNPHVHRISSRLGWVKKQTNDHEMTRKELESWVPYDLWCEINPVLTGFGKKICQAEKPNCGKCLNKMLCPVGRIM